jgi:hypothetical protein
VLAHHLNLLEELRRQNNGKPAGIRTKEEGLQAALLMEPFGAFAEGGREGQVAVSGLTHR